MEEKKVHFVFLCCFFLKSFQSSYVLGVDFCGVINFCALSSIHLQPGKKSPTIPQETRSVCISRSLIRSYFWRIKKTVVNPNPFTQVIFLCRYLRNYFNYQTTTGSLFAEAKTKTTTSSSISWRQGNNRCFVLGFDHSKVWMKLFTREAPSCLQLKNKSF